MTFNKSFRSPRLLPSHARNKLGSNYKAGVRSIIFLQPPTFDVLTPLLFGIISSTIPISLQIYFNIMSYIHRLMMLLLFTSKIKLIKYRYS